MCDFKQGDRVVFKEWNEMAEEYEIDAFGDIKIGKGPFFVTHMRDLCGQEFTIRSIDSDDNVTYVKFDVSEDAFVNRWTICTGMLKHVVDSADCDFDVDQDAFIDILCG